MLTYRFIQHQHSIPDLHVKDYMTKGLKHNSIDFAKGITVTVSASITNNKSVLLRLQHSSVVQIRGIQ